MFDNPYSLIRIIVIVSAIAYAIFRFQLLKEIFSGFRNWKKSKNENEFNSKVDDYLLSYELSKVREEEKLFLQNFVNPIKLQVLKIVENEGKYSIFIYNHGGNASNIEISSNEVDDITIEPKTDFKNGSSACISFYYKHGIKNKIRFFMEYTDERMKRSSTEHIISILENKLEELKK